MTNAEQANRAKLKKRIILFFSIICLILVVSYGGIAIYSILNKPDTPQNADSQHATKHEFYQPDWEEDIYLDSGYMELDRTISIRDGAVTVGVLPEEYAQYGDAVVFLAQFIQTIIDGDHEAYNACFSDAYWETHAKQNIFTPQKLYNILLCEIEREEVTQNGISHTVYTYSVEYMIRRNNGTFRRDIGSDAVRPQYLIISDQKGEMKIDNILAK